MWKKIAIGGAIAAAIVGTGTASLALTGSTAGSTPGTGTPGSASTGSASTGSGGRHPGAIARVLHREAVLHGSITVKNPKTGDVVTHDASQGTVTAVSATSITVRPSDNTTQTYVVSSSTVVRQRTNGKGTKSAIDSVHDGDEVYVLGTGTGPLTASLIVDTGK